MNSNINRRNIDAKNFNILPVSFHFVLILFFIIALKLMILSHMYFLFSLSISTSNFGFFYSLEYTTLRVLMSECAYTVPTKQLNNFRNE